MLTDTFSEPYHRIILHDCTGVGMEAIEGLRFLSSLPLAGTGRTEGGEKTQPFNRFHSSLFTCVQVRRSSDLEINKQVNIDPILSVVAQVCFCASVRH